MEAEIIDLQRWKKAHPPAIVLLNAGLAAALAWQKLWLTLAFSHRPLGK